MRRSLIAALLVAGCGSRTELSKDEVLDAVKARRDDIRACRTDGRHIVRTRLLVLPEGTVSDVDVQAPPALAAAGQCLANVLRALRFEPFAGEPTEIDLPVPL